MLTKKQVEEIKPEPFKPVLSYTRYRNGQIVPNTRPRFKREWKFEGTHSVTIPDGTTEIRDGGYFVKMAR